MPTYSYTCTACQKNQDAVRRIAERDDCPKCERCFGNTERRIVAAMVSVFTPYRAVAADKDSGEFPVIRTKAEHSAYLRRNGFEEVGNDRAMAPKSVEEIAHRRAEKLAEERSYALNHDTHEAELEASP